MTEIVYDCLSIYDGVAFLSDCTSLVVMRLKLTLSGVPLKSIHLFKNFQNVFITEW